MATKKKKKPASNPSRGFATVSTISKVKAQDVEANDSLDTQHDPTHNLSARETDTDVPVKQASRNSPEKDLDELTPEQLERQLEESSLQVFLDRYGAKVKKDVSRHASRLYTERRLSRNQAERLSARQWLPPEIMQLIFTLSSDQIDQNDSSVNALEVRQDICNASEDDVLARLWTLRLLLPQIGYSPEATSLALRHLLEVRNGADASVLLSTKDSVWGLDLCLQRLALVLPSDALTSFDSIVIQQHSRRNRTSDQVHGGVTKPSKLRLHISFDRIVYDL